MATVFVSYRACIRADKATAATCRVSQMWVYKASNWCDYCGYKTPVMTSKLNRRTACRPRLIFSSSQSWKTTSVLPVPLDGFVEWLRHQRAPASSLTEVSVVPILSLKNTDCGPPLLTTNVGPQSVIFLTGARLVLQVLQSRKFQKSKGCSR